MMPKSTPSEACVRCAPDGDRRVAAATIGLRWADGTPFRVTCYTHEQWDELDPSKRPEAAWVDDTGSAVFAFTPE